MAIVQQNLFAGGETGVVPLARNVERYRLDDHCWVDYASHWLRGADELLPHFIASLQWRQGTRTMWGNLLEEPRLSATIRLGRSSPHQVIDRVAHELGRYYGYRFDRVWCNYYRTGSDSVAWHGDRVGKHQLEPVVAICSVGGPRTFQLRPRGGGPSIRFPMASGDLLVMGGRCQQRWEHAVPKVRQAYPRISVTFRHGPGAEPVDLQTRLPIGE